MSVEKKNVLIIVLSAIALLTVFAVTYAYFVVVPTINGQKQSSVIETGTLQLTFEDNDSGVAGTLHFGDSIEKKFVITNTGSIDVYAKMEWLELTNTYLEGSLVYDLYYSDTYSETNEGYKKLGKTINVPRNTSGTPITTTLMDYLLIPADNTTGSATYHNKKRYYTLRITLVDSPTVDQTADINATFNTKFTLVEGDTTNFVHLSFDDVEICLNNLTNNNYDSLFDEPFFK